MAGGWVCFTLFYWQAPLSVDGKLQVCTAQGYFVICCTRGNRDTESHGVKGSYEHLNPNKTLTRGL